MALGTPTDRGNARGYADTHTVAAFTPSANCLLVASITHGAAATITSITGHGTWTQIGSDVTAGNGIVTRMYGCITSGSPSSSTVVMVTSAVLTSLIEITEITGTVVTSVAAAITQTKGATGLDAAPSVTFDATPTKTTLASCYSGTDVTALDGTNLLDLAYVYSQNFIITSYTATPGDATVDGTLSASAYWVILAIEFAEAGGGGGGGSNSNLLAGKLGGLLVGKL